MEAKGELSTHSYSACVEQAAAEAMPVVNNHSAWSTGLGLMRPYGGMPVSEYDSKSTRIEVHAKSSDFFTYDAAVVPNPVGSSVPVRSCCWSS